MPKRKGPERRERKRARKLKGLSMKERRISNKIKDKQIWEIAKRMTQHREDYEGKKFKCPKCDKYYCVGFDGRDAYCEKCWYWPCQNLSIGERNCYECGGSQRELRPLRPENKNRNRVVVP